MRSVRSFLGHPFTLIAAQLALGGLLLAASWHKVGHPPDFEKVIKNYKLFPKEAIPLLTIYMPWIEVFTALGLIVGVGRRGGSLLAAFLMASFIAVLSYNLARGCPTVCGCFSTYEASKHLSDADKFWEMKKEIALDVGLLVLAGYVFLASGYRASLRAPPSPAAS